MFRAIEPEKIIQKMTGHWSIEALHVYERVCTDQQKAVYKTLMANGFEFGIRLCITVVLQTTLLKYWATSQNA